MSILPSLAHGFLVPSPIAEVLYKTADYYHPQSEVWFVWGDLGLGINWPLPDGIEFIMSAKDALGLLPKQPVGNVS